MRARKTANLLVGLRFDKSLVGIVRPFDDPTIWALNPTQTPGNALPGGCLLSRLAWPIQQKHYHHDPNP
jgi:hypothetical protein